MGVLAQTSNFQNCIKTTNKIPEYARDFKKEFLFIIGVNKLFHKFEDKYEIYESKIYNSIYCDKIKYFIKRFLKFQEYGYLKDTSCFVFRKFDVFYIEDIYLMLRYDYEMYTDDEMSNDDFYPGFRDFYNLFCKFYDKINAGYDDIDEGDFYLKTIEIYSDPRNKVIVYDSDSDSDSDSD